MSPKYANLGFFCRLCQNFLSIAQLFPTGRYSAGPEIKARCPKCNGENSFTPADLQLQVSRASQR